MPDLPHLALAYLWADLHLRVQAEGCGYTILPFDFPLSYFCRAAPQFVDCCVRESPWCTGFKNNLVLPEQFVSLPRPSWLLID